MYGSCIYGSSNLLVQGDSLATGSKLLSIKNDIIEIMT